MVKQVSALLLLALLGCLLTQANCLQLQHQQEEIYDLLQEGKCKYAYVISPYGEEWGKLPPSAPDAGQFAVSPMVFFEGIDFELLVDQNARRLYLPFDRSNKGVLLIKLKNVYVAGVWDQSNNNFSCQDEVEAVASQLSRKGY